MLSELINNISSYDSNIMLAAVISLLVVILFVLLLHIYAKWFLEQATHRHTITSRSSSVSVSHHHVLRPSRLSSSSSSTSPTKGLDPSIISSIPLFVYRVEEEDKSLECVICLSFFEENEVGRTFTKCGHCFHVQCIDTWLHSHSNCPICRAPAIIKSMEPAPEVGLSDGGDSTVQEISNSENHDNGNNNNNNVVINYDSPSSSSSVLGCSVKRLLSRSTSERKVFPSTNNGPEMSV